MADLERRRVLNISRTRVVFVVASGAIMLLFSALLLAQRAVNDDLLRALGNLSEVVHLVHSEYVDEVDLGDLREGLEAGIVESVDPWAGVLGDQDLALFRQLVESPPAFGLVLDLRVGLAAVRHVVPDSPASDAGIDQWEIIEFIDGESTRGLPLWQLRLTLLERQLDKESVRLTIVDRDMEERRDVVLEGREWQPSPVSAEDHEGIMVVRLDNLAPGAGAEVAEAVGSGAPVVLDLRELLWGQEAEALLTADLFFGEGTLGGWKGRRAGSKTFEAKAETATATLPVVLIARDTEGVGEILASSLQRGGATLVGESTAGHAPHMMLIHAGEMHLWLPVGNWLLADGEAIQGEGVQPDEEIELAPEDDEGVEGVSEDDEGAEGAPEDDEDDPVLERALELAAGELAKAA